MKKIIPAALLAMAAGCVADTTIDPAQVPAGDTAQSVKCQHDWRRANNGFVYCSLPPKYDFTCSKCGETKVDVDPLEAWCYQMPKDIEIIGGIDYTLP